MRSFLLLFIVIACTEIILGQNTKSTTYFDEAQSLRKTNPERAKKKYLLAIRGADSKDLDLKLRSMNELLRMGLQNSRDLREWIIRIRHHIDSSERQDSLVGTFFFGSGSFYDEVMHEGDSAVLYYRQASKIRSRIFGEQSEQLAVCYHRIGDVYKYLTYDFNSAELYYEKALSIREKLPETNERELAMNFYNLATTNRSQHDYEKAIAYGTRSIMMVEKLNDRKFLEITYSGMANIYRDAGDKKQAREYYEKAVELNRQNGDQKNFALANHYRGLGLVLREEGLNQDALEAFEISASIFLAVDPLSLLHVYTLQQLGETHSAIGDRAKSIKTYRKALSIIYSMGIKDGGQLADIYLSIGDYYKKNGKLDSALNFYQRSLNASTPSFRSTDIHENPAMESIALREIASLAINAKASAFSMLYKKTGNVRSAEEALHCFSVAELLMSSGRSDLDMELSKWRYVDSKYELYEQSIEVVYDLLLKSPQDSLVEKAFYFIEKSKSKSLADALFMAENSNPALFADPLLDSLRMFRASIVAYQNKLTNATMSDRKVLQDSIVNLDRKVMAVETAIDQRYPSYRKIKYNFSIPSLAEIVRYARKHNAVFIEYFWGNNFVYALGVNSDGYTLKRLGQTDSIRNSIEQMTMRMAHILAMLLPEKILSDPKQVGFQAALKALKLAPLDIVINDHYGRLIIFSGLFSIAMAEFYDPLNELRSECFIHKGKSPRIVLFNQLKKLSISHTLLSVNR